MTETKELPRSSLNILKSDQPASSLTQNSMEETPFVLKPLKKCSCISKCACEQADVNIKLCLHDCDDISAEAKVLRTHKSTKSSFIKLATKVQHKSAGNSFLQNVRQANETQQTAHSHTSSINGLGQQVVRLQTNLQRKPPIVNSKSSKYLLLKPANASSVANESYEPDQKKQVYQASQLKLTNKFQTTNNSLRHSRE